MTKIASILGILVATIAGAPAQSAELATGNRAEAWSQHCCWDTPWNIQITNGSGPVSANSWSAGGQADSTAGYGVLRGDIATFANNRGFTYSSGRGSVSDGWADSLTFHSASLGVGTAIQFRLNVFLDYDYALTRTDAGVASFIAKAAFLGDGIGLDARDVTSWQAGTVFELHTSQAGAGSGHREASTLRTAAIGDTVNLRGYLSLYNESLIPDSTLGRIDSEFHGRAYYTVDILTPDVGFTSLGGAPYLLAPVPEPETYAMLLAGLGLLGALARRRKARRTA